jgi:hypothetical protein
MYEAVIKLEKKKNFLNLINRKKSWIARGAAGLSLSAGITNCLSQVSLQQVFPTNPSSKIEGTRKNFQIK